MKTIHALLIVLLASLYNAAQNCTDIDADKPSFCHGLTLTTGQYRCCYIYAKAVLFGIESVSKKCTPVTKAEFDNIKQYEKASKEMIEKMGGKVLSLDINCFSNYLYISLLSLMIFLL